MNKAGRRWKKANTARGNRAARADRAGVTRDDRTRGDHTHGTHGGRTRGVTRSVEWPYQRSYWPPQWYVENV